MKFRQLLISLTLAGGSLFFPISLINKRVDAGGMAILSKIEITKNITSLITPAISEKVSLTDKISWAESRVLATRLVLKLKERRVYAYQDDRLLASYRVAIGKKGWETPQGKFEITQMVKNPKWENPWNGRISAPGPNSPLGERWIGFWTDGKDSIGFHGTPGEHLMGQAVSHGCVRMKNADVRALFELVDKGILVIVQP
ncbi:L,D-transpeptidase [Cyanobacterium sp. uoEpiScrs1]|uniref:L,D-transpeptidase n=1 Tax=Cyanobacterium sp. uoEpiScrs1 TaxID=2976343 RepID=UPI003A5CE942